MKRILFLEDNDEYRGVITRILEKNNYNVTAVSSSLEAIELFSFNEYDLVLSDLYIDELNGIKFLTYVKRIVPNQKTILLTGKPSMDTELEALNIYVDKYLSKDTRLDVFIKYVDTVLNTLPSEMKDLNRKEVVQSEAENLYLDTKGYVVIKNDEQYTLPLKEFNLLKLLIENKGTALSRDEIIEELWDTEYVDVDPRIVDQHIKELRKKLKIQCIVTIRGYGYKWDE